MTDPADCGPVTLSLCQDVQAESYHYPSSFFEPRIWEVRRIRPDEQELASAISLLSSAKKPMIIAGGGVRYSHAQDILSSFSAKTGIPVASTQAGKSSLPEAHEAYMGSLGVTGSSAANALAEEADVILAVGSRLQDFVTGSNSLIKGHVIALNVQAHDLVKHDATPLMADAKIGLEALADALSSYQVDEAYRAYASQLNAAWWDKLMMSPKPRLIMNYQQIQRLLALLIEPVLKM